MSTFLFDLKNYLYTKNKVRYLIPVLAVFIFTSCTQPTGSQNYDAPPTAPIPPAKYCFERIAGGNSNVTRAEIYLEGDSAYGKIDYAKSDSAPSGDFKGVIYGTTLIIKYTFKSDTGLVVQEQQWKLADDTLTRTTLKAINSNAAAASGDSTSLSASYSYSLHKVACK